MRINRLALIKACERAESEHRRRHQESQAKRDKQRHQEMDVWRTAWADQWAAAALNIRKVLRNGGAVTRDMLPINERFRDVAIFRGDAAQHPYEPLRELAALRTILETVQDDVVTIGALERLGLARNTIRTAAQYLEAATIQGADT